MLNINFWNIAFTIINIVVLYLFLKDVHSGREETDGGKGIR